MKKFNLFFCFIGFFLVVISCKPDKKESIGNQNQPQSIKPDIKGSYEVNNDESIIDWVGSKPAGKHNGQIKIKSGEIIFQNGRIKSGKFIIDMNTINVLDLEGDDKKDLENHLKGTVEGKENHFFNVAKYPKSQFIIKSVDKVENGHKVYGVLTIKEISNPIEFQAQLTFGSDNKTVKLISAPFKIDRTRWGIEFMSKSVFDDLKNKFISDDIQLQVKLKANKI